jgi:PAS domain S-box-containing protein
LLRAVASRRRRLAGELAGSRGELAAALRENQTLLGAISEHGAFTVTDAAGRILEVNDRFCRISGYRRDELVGQRHHVVNSGVHPSEFWKEMWTTISAGRGWRGEVCNRARDGRLYWVDSVIAPLIGADGNIERYFSLHHEITARKLAERTLLARERQMRLMIDAFPGRLAYWDRQLNCTFAGSHGAPAGRGSDPVCARPELLADIAATAPQVQAALRGEPQSVERTALGADGVERHYLVRYVPDWDGDKVRGFISAATEVTELKRAQTVLEVQKARAELASVAKGQFLANMSHEIRTPLNAILGMQHLLACSELGGEQRDMLDKAQLAGRALLGIVNNVLDLTKIEAGGLMLDEAELDPADLLREVHAVYQAQALTRGIALHVDGLDGLPPRLVGDALRLRQIVTNLVGNAIKFTDRGEVRLAVAVAVDCADRVRLRITVRDTGIGIAADVLPSLFAPFAQADTSTARRFGGTGLGLSIARQLAHLMGGEIGATSEPGCGSEFWVVLPFTVPAIGAAPAIAVVDDSARRGLPDARLLVVDDNEINLEVARRVLEGAGARVETCSTGEQALAVLRAAPSAFDAVLMDVQMTGMDGMTTTRRVRGELGLTRLPILALTAGALVEEREHALAAGMDDFLSKPFDAAELTRVLQAWIESSREPAPGSAIDSSGPPSRAARRGARTSVAPRVAAWPWPEIDGIDAAAVAARSNLDAWQYIALLRRMLREFADLAVPVAAPTQPGERAALAARMHKLAGGASQLGATRVQDAAGALEAALRDAPEQDATAPCDALAAALSGLAAACGPAFEAAARAGHEDSDGNAAAITGAQRSELLHRLEARDLRVLDQIEALAPALQHALGARFPQLQRLLDDLDFEAARSLLQDAGGG